MDMEILFPGGKKIDAVYNGFTIKTDQSVEHGGEGSAPAPFDLFLASIGTCAAIYVAAFCEYRQIDTSDIRIGLNFDRNEKTGMIENISFEVTLPASFPEKYEKAVVRAINQCAVKKHMIEPPQFQVNITKGA